MKRLRDDDRILRDIENIPEQRRREGLMAILEQDLGLDPLSGDSAIVDAARETRCRILEELSIDWEQKYARREAVLKHNPKAVLKPPGLLDTLKRKDAQFWFQHRDSAPEEAFLSELFELEPIEGDSPLMADARLARYRVLWELLGLQLKEKEEDNHEVMEMVAEILTQESPQFWYERMNFSADELIKLRFPDIQNWQTPSERKKYALYGAASLCVSAMFLYFFIVLYQADSDELKGFCAFFSMAAFVAALVMFSFIKGDPGGKGLDGKSKE